MYTTHSFAATRAMKKIKIVLKRPIVTSSAPSEQLSSGNKLLCRQADSDPDPASAESLDTLMNDCFLMLDLDVTTSKPAGRNGISGCRHVRVREKLGVDFPNPFAGAGAVGKSRFNCNYHDILCGESMTSNQ